MALFHVPHAHVRTYFSSFCAILVAITRVDSASGCDAVEFWLEKGIPNELISPRQILLLVNQGDNVRELLSLSHFSRCRGARCVEMCDGMQQCM
jgi:hypothetical protein